MNGKEIKISSENITERDGNRPIARRLRLALGATADRLMDPAGHHQRAVIERYMRRGSEKTPNRGLGRRALRFMVDRAAPDLRSRLEPSSEDRPAN